MKKLLLLACAVGLVLASMGPVSATADTTTETCECVMVDSPGEIPGAPDCLTCPPSHDGASDTKTKTEVTTDGEC
jgi:hypothetical protein